MENLLISKEDSADAKVKVELTFEELEAKIAPGVQLGVQLNHNETLVLDDEEKAKAMLQTDVEELEAKIAPGIRLNHNETMLQDNA